jgi:hypothetical protein
VVAFGSQALGLDQRVLVSEVRIGDPSFWWLRRTDATRQPWFRA